MPPYSKTTWVDGSLPAIDASKLNKIEQGIFDSLRQDGSTTMSGQLVTTAGSSATPAIAPTGDSNTGIFFPAADTIAFGENGAEAMRINSSGNVGIGTTSPTNKLQIAGVTANTSCINAIANTTTGQSFGIALSAGSNSSDYALNIRNATQTSQLFHITGAGNVGIGTTSPDVGSTGNKVLTVAGAFTRARLQLQNTDGGVSAVAGTLQFINGSNDLASITATSDSGSGSTGFLTFTTNLTERMRITSAGNVGIGTTSPTEKLQVNATSGNVGLNINTADAGAVSYLSLSNTGASGKRYSLNVGGNTIGSGLTNNLFLYDNDNAAVRFLITPSGNVGIGTTATDFGSYGASAKVLTILSTSSFAVTELATQATPANANVLGVLAFENKGAGISTPVSAQIVGFQDGTNSLYAGGKLIFYTRADASTTLSERLIITNSGNVGIGVNPNVELHVKGTGEILRLETTAATGDNFIRFYAPSATTQGYIGYTSAANNNMSINQVLNNDLLFFTNNTERMRIQNSGGVIPSANNTYDLGSSSFRWATIYAQNALNTSDARLKTDVEPSSLGLDFIASLNPVQYRWIEGGNTVEKIQTGTETVEITPAILAKPEVMDEEGNIIQEATQEVPAVTEEKPIYETVVTPREGVRTHFGLIAQEVKAALPDGLDFAGWCLADKDDADSTQSLGYTQLIAPMIKAIQELKAEIEALKAQLNK